MATLSDAIIIGLHKFRIKEIRWSFVGLFTQYLLLLDQGSNSLNEQEISVGF